MRFERIPRSRRTLRASLVTDFHRRVIDDLQEGQHHDRYSTGFARCAEEILSMAMADPTWWRPLEAFGSERTKMHQMTETLLFFVCQPAAT